MIDRRQTLVVRPVGKDDVVAALASPLSRGSSSRFAAAASRVVA